jgi:hypothetical protein
MPVHLARRGAFGGVALGAGETLDRMGCRAGEGAPSMKVSIGGVTPHTPFTAVADSLIDAATVRTNSPPRRTARHDRAALTGS